MIVLDTHVLVWWLNGDQSLSSKAKSALKKCTNIENSIKVSAICAWEIAMLVEKGRLVINMDVDSWLAEADKISAISFVPIDVETAVKSTSLPGSFHKDPADRIIVSLARHLALPLVTADQQILNYTHVQTIW